MFIRNWTGWAHFLSNAREKLTQLTGTKELVKEITGREAEISRKKR
jgi:hypothetical protein